MVVDPRLFRTPRRRDTRQRSGFHVAGNYSGNEAMLARVKYFELLSPTLDITLNNSEQPLPEQFASTSGMAAVGGYAKTAKDATITVSLRVIDHLAEEPVSIARDVFSTKADRWIGFGVHTEVDDCSAYDSIDLQATVHIEDPKGEPLGKVQLIGVALDSLTAYADRPIHAQFDTKTSIYLPEIYYFDHTKPFSIEPAELTGAVTDDGEGEQLVLKACNRCARFLPIDVLNERRELGFSNHCVKRAPCTHRSFSRFAVENAKLSDVASELRSIVRPVSGALEVSTQFGFQLECRPCKKFNVNAPLNPLRNSTQHREDGLRRRAFEQLVMHLLERDWIFFTFRKQYGKEFDTYIWNRFDRRCFNCNQELSTPQEMDLDHTLPLNYLWPLDDTATCLCATCNSQKHARFPSEFYHDPRKLQQLAALTGLPSSVLNGKHINAQAVARLREEVIWFFDTFLAHPDFQKVRHGKKAADLILASLQRVLDESHVGWNLIHEYTRLTGTYPYSVSLGY